MSLYALLHSHSIITQIGSDLFNWIQLSLPTPPTNNYFSLVNITTFPDSFYDLKGRVKRKYSCEMDSSYLFPRIDVIYIISLYIWSRGTYNILIEKLALRLSFSDVRRTI